MIHHKNGRNFIGLSCFDPYNARWLRRHVAFCAIRLQKGDIDRIGHFAKIMVGGGMTALAILSIFFVVAMVIDMGIVAGRAIHFAHPKAFTGGQERDLVAVNVGPGGADLVRQDKMRKRVAGPEPKHCP